MKTKCALLFVAQQVLSDLNKSMCLRLDSIESKLRTLDERTKYLETQMGEILQKQCIQCMHSMKAEYVNYNNSNKLVTICCCDYYRVRTDPGKS